MYKYLVITSLIALAGCSSTKTVVQQEPYCYTDQTIQQSSDGTFNSNSTLQCSDNPLKRAKLAPHSERWMLISQPRYFFAYYQNYYFIKSKNIKNLLKILKFYYNPHKNVFKLVKSILNK